MQILTDIVLHGMQHVKLFMYCEALQLEMLVVQMLFTMDKIFLLWL